MTTACTSNNAPTTQPTNATEPTTSTLPATQPTNATEPTIRKVKPLDMNLEALNRAEFIELSAKQVTLSSEDLSLEDCLEMGTNFKVLMTYCISNFSEKFQKQIADDAYEAFCNISEQAESKFSLNFLSTWMSVPEKRLLLECYEQYEDWSFKEFTGLFSNPIYLGLLSEQDALEVASSLLVIYDFEGTLSCLQSKYHKVQEMAIKRLVEISKPNDFIDFIPEYYQLLFTSYVADEECNIPSPDLKIIRKNILENQNFQFAIKYISFCEGSDKKLVEETLEQLIIMAKSKPDEQANIRRVANLLRNAEHKNKLLSALSE